MIDQKLGSSINSLCLSEHKNPTLKPILAYGLQNGSFGLAEVTKDEVIILWEIDYADMGMPKRSPVSFVQFGPIKDKNTLVVVRDDNSIELYVIEDQNLPGQLVFETKEHETITGLVIGNISNTKHKEILITCYSGAVKSLVNKKQMLKMGTLTEDTSNLTSQQIHDEQQQKMKVLQNEIV